MAVSHLTGQPDGAGRFSPPWLAPTSNVFPLSAGTTSRVSEPRRPIVPIILRLSDAQIQQHQALVKQARTMFGVEHFQRYEFYCYFPATPRSMV